MSNTFIIVLGNVLSLIATGFCILNGTRKTKREMLYCDMGSAITFTLSDFVLKGYSGVVQNLVGLARDIVALFFKESKAVAWFLVGCGVVFGVLFNNHGIIGLLPVATCFYYSICVINPNTTEDTMKIGLILNSLSFAIYCVVIYNFVGIVTNMFVVVPTLISYLKNKK